MTQTKNETIRFILSYLDDERETAMIQQSHFGALYFTWTKGQTEAKRTKQKKTDKIFGYIGFFFFHKGQQLLLSGRNNAKRSIQSCQINVPEDLEILVPS